MMVYTSQKGRGNAISLAMKASLTIVLIAALAGIPACWLDVDVTGSWRGSYRLTHVGSVVGTFDTSDTCWALPNEQMAIGPLSTTSFDIDSSLTQGMGGSVGGTFGDPDRNLTFPEDPTKVQGRVTKGEETQVCVNTVRVIDPASSLHPFAPRGLDLDGAEGQTVVRYVSLVGLVDTTGDRIEGTYQEVLSGMVPHAPGELIVMMGEFKLQRVSGE